MEDLVYQRLYNRLDSHSCPPLLRNNYTAYALTEENVSKVLFVDPSSTPLARYCNELECSTTYSSSTSSSQNQSRFTATDSVLESPRVLPFPYHNDSYFLPTAEHDYPGGSTNDASSMAGFSIGSRQPNLRSTGKCSMDSTNRLVLLTDRYEDACTKNRNLNSVNVSVSQKIYTPLRSRRIIFKNNNVTNCDQKKYQLRLKPKDFFFKRKNTPLRNISYCHTTTSSLSETYAEELELVSEENQTQCMAPWYKKFLNVFRKSRKLNKMSVSNSTSVPSPMPATVI